MNPGEPTDPQQRQHDPFAPTPSDPYADRSAPVPPTGHTSPVPPYAHETLAPEPGQFWAPPPAGAYDWSQQQQPLDGSAAPAWAPPAPVAPRRRHRAGLMVAAGVAALALVGGGVGIGVAVTPTGSSSTAAGTTTNPNSDTRPNQQFPGFGDGVTPDGTDGTGSTGSDGSGSTGSGTTGGTSGSVTSAATDAQSTGVVVIDTVLGYQNAQAAGTGMVLSSDGTVLTNNHVVEGSTSIRVTVISTGRTYNASVVGTDASDDVAVIKLSGASGLDTVTTDTTSNISTGTSVVAVGNAGGTGSLTAATGTVTATGQSITATDDSGANAEQLEGLLQTDAAIQAGDSGGPLFDTDGDVVGINTAAATTQSGATAAGYAIPIGDAVTIAKQIVAGDESDTIRIGLPAFLGISLSQQQTGAATGGATIAGVIADLPAAQAGLVAGDTITAVDGTTVSSASDLSTVMDTLDPGQSVSLTWTTADGSSQTAQVTLVEGPAA